MREEQNIARSQKLRRATPWVFQSGRSTDDDVIRDFTSPCCVNRQPPGDSVQATNIKTATDGYDFKKATQPIHGYIVTFRRAILTLFPLRSQHLIPSAPFANL
jgi:hypothetical protein